jgi:hypothetical protein
MSQKMAEFLLSHNGLGSQLMMNINSFKDRKSDTSEFGCKNPLVENC